MTTDFPTAPRAYGLNGPSAPVTVEKSPHASHTEILTPPGRYISPNALGGLFLNIQDAGTQPPHQQLSAREMQIMLLIVQGVSLTEIGERMFLSVKTIGTYRTRILAKLGLENNANLVRYALSHGLS